MHAVYLRFLVRKGQCTVKHVDFGYVVDVRRREFLMSNVLRILPNALSGDAQLAWPRSRCQIGKSIVEVVDFGLALVV